VAHKSRWHHLTDAGIHVVEKGKFMVMIVINRSTESVKKTDRCASQIKLNFMLVESLLFSCHFLYSVPGCSGIFALYHGSVA